MGQKVNPHGLRVGVIKDWNSKWFADKKGRLGLSQGCPAVSPDKIESLIRRLKGQGLLYIHKNAVNP